METFKIDFEETGFFSKTILDYLKGRESIRHFYKYVPSYESIPLIIEEKNMQSIDRDLLVEVLLDQNKGVSLSENTLQNINSLKKENSFTITTAHQPVIFGGPLFMVIKVICTINMCKKLRDLYPEFNFVPVFWMGTEDHDFEEVNHSFFFGRKLEWKSEPEGATGRMNSQRMRKLFPELEEILEQSTEGKKLIALFRQAYLEHETLARATRFLFNELFGDDGLVIIDGDHSVLKKQFTPVMEEEILYRNSEHIIAETNQKLAEKYKVQAFARQINLFYMKEGFRERIVYNSGNQSFEVLNSHLYFDEESIVEELHQYPERFSPNVILRPLYQEKVLPNLAYVGGGGEIAYWLQLEALFEKFRINYPMLIVRNSLVWIDMVSSKRMEAFGLKIKDLFKDPNEMINQYILDQSQEEITLSDERSSLRSIFKSIQEKAGDIDHTLKKTVLGEEQKAINALEKIEAKIIKAEKKKNETVVNQIRKIYSKTFPENELMERKENFSSFYIRHGESFFDLLKKELQPLDKEVVVVRE